MSWIEYTSNLHTSEDVCFSQDWSEVQHSTNSATIAMLHVRVRHPRCIDNAMPNESSESLKQTGDKVLAFR